MKKALDNALYFCVTYFAMRMTYYEGNLPCFGKKTSVLKSVWRFLKRNALQKYWYDCTEYKQKDSIFTSMTIPSCSNFGKFISMVVTIGNRLLHNMLLEACSAHPLSRRATTIGSHLFFAPDSPTNILLVPSFGGAIPPVCDKNFCMWWCQTQLMFQLSSFGSFLIIIMPLNLFHVFSIVNQFVC